MTYGGVALSFVQEFYAALNREELLRCEREGVVADRGKMKRNITVGADNLLGLFAYLVIHARPSRMFAQVCGVLVCRCTRACFLCISSFSWRAFHHLCVFVVDVQAAFIMDFLGEDDMIQIAGFYLTSLTVRHPGMG